MATESGKNTGDENAKASEKSGVGTGKSLDSLLAEWGESSSAEPEKDVVGRVLKKVEPALDFVRTEQERREIESLQGDLDSALNFMLEPDEYKEFPKRWMRGYLEGYSTENQDFSKAFAERREHPEKWKSELARAREQFPEWLKELPMSKVRTDVEAAKAAVKGSSTERVEEPDKSEQEQAAELFDMSEGEYRRTIRKELAKASAR